MALRVVCPVPRIHGAPQFGAQAARASEWQSSGMHSMPAAAHYRAGHFRDAVARCGFTDGAGGRC